MSAVRTVLQEQIVDARSVKNMGAADIPARRACKLTTDLDGVDLATATTDLILGVSTSEGLEKPRANGGGTLIVAGTINTAPTVCLMTAGGTISRGDRITTDGSGRGILGASGNSQVGIAMVDAPNLGSIFEIQLSPPGTVIP